MSFWIAAFVLSCATALGLVVPLRRAAQGRTALESARDHYRARLAELNRQREAGEISEQDFARGEAEEGRRLLGVKRNDDHEDRDPARGRSAVIGAVMGLLSIGGGVALYARLGTPAMPDQPLASRAQAQQMRGLQDALARIDLHIARNPEDRRAYEVAAPAYLEAGRFADAANAFAKLIALSGETAELQASMGESLVADRNGVVSAEARAAFERAVALDASHGKALFYLALATEQDGDVSGAISKLKSLHQMLPEGPGRMRVAAELQRFIEQGREDARLQGMPSRDAQAAIAAMSPEERRAAIRGMVEGLEARLISAGGSVTDWQRLVQAWIVLGDRERARGILAKARENIGADGPARAAFDAFVASNGIETRE